MSSLESKVSWSDRAWLVVGKFGTIMVLAALVIFLSFAAPTSFASPINLINVLSQISLTAIVACSVTFVLVAGEFDLSIGYQASFGGVLVAGLMSRSGLPPLLAVLMVIGAGAAIGLVNGLLVTKLGVNALIATLGTGTVVLGINYIYSGGAPVSLPRGTDFTQLALGGLFGIPWTVYIMVAVVAVLWVVLNHTPIGQSIQAVGESREAAALSGIRISRVVILTFIIAGAGAALAGSLLAARVGSGQLTAGDGYLLSAFAAAFLGSAALRDGEFHVLGTFIGVLTVGVGINGLGILGAPSSMQYVFSGGLLVVAVALSSVARRRTNTRASHT